MLRIGDVLNIGRLRRVLGGKLRDGCPSDAFRPTDFVAPPRHDADPPVLEEDPPAVVISKEDQQ